MTGGCEVQTNIDLSHVFDNCYPGYEDFTAEMTLRWNPDNRKWENETVSFWKEDSSRWKYRASTGEYNYGYDTLKEAITKYVGGLAGKQAAGTGKDFCASRLLKVNYERSLKNGEIFCRVNLRHFLPECDEQLFQQKCEDLTAAFGMLLQ